MNPDDWKKIEGLFFELADLPSKEREKRLSSLAQEQPDLYPELKALLEEEDTLHPLLNSSPATNWSGWEDKDLLGQKIGIYRLVSLLGSGGMGSVFEAERADGSFEQRVALKLMKEGLYNAQNVQSFLQERQILANLQHPHIAQLLDGGIYEGAEGERPYYTLEYIEGLPLDQYCEQHKLGVDDRLSLFCQVCEAVQHAHSQLILHLDIKPSNILVDGKGRGKLLDFGISQLLSQTGRDKEYTPGKSYTLAFASPEQLLGERLSTASDVYSLGVLLFQLLSGKHPFQGAMTDRSVLRSHILNQAASSPRDQMENEELPYSVRSISKDLDLICAKALRKNPGERYASALALKEDIQHVLENRPISLRKNDWAYAIKKYAARNASLFFLSLVGILLLVGLTSYYTWKLKEERDLATYEAAKARRVSELMSDMFSQANPNVSLGKEPSASELLNQGISRVEAKLKDDPEMLAEMYQVMAQVYLDRAEFGRADTLVTSAINLLDSLSEKPNLDRVASYYQLGVLKYRQSAYDESREALQIALDLGIGLQGRENPLKREILTEWANLETEVGRYKVSDSLLEQVLIGNKGNRSIPDSLMAQVQLTLGINARKLTDYNRAEGYYQEALAIRKKIYPPIHPEIAYALNHMASLYVDQQNNEEALPYAQESYAIRKEVFGSKHPETMASLSNVSRIQNSLGNYELARQHYREIYDILAEIYGFPHHYHGAIKGNIANTYLKEGNSQEAVKLFKEALDIVRQTLPPGHVRLGFVYNNYGIGLLQDKAYAQGEQAFREALRIREKGLPADHKDIALTQKGLGFCLLYQGKNKEGREHLLAAKDILMKDPQAFSKELAEINEGLGVRNVE